MTGPLDCFTTFSSGEVAPPSFGAPASLAACAARASGVQVRPVITAAAPITALRTRNARRSMGVAIAGSADEFTGGLLFSFCGVFMLHPLHLICVYWWFAFIPGRKFTSCASSFQNAFKPVLRKAATVLSVTAGEGGEVLRNGYSIASFSHLK